ncbi:N-acetyl-gamma-glutamyl-phosphate reductase [Agrilactobacillus yilanensis]|uniref:N-acetyl-gamma-glutamyl-phosphate reductase n=1 Tax=Agrilactobacillus yilanensis TaxID=2485997 RepID=A0ABW4J6K6_9LACO|nr:N-acetyl-gamma-glutamyl-phosphate reductase [Agrilactobacillus yilanensis]
MNIALVGVTGYSGQCLYQLLQQHPHVDQIDLYGHGTDNTYDLKENWPLYMNINTKIKPFDVAEILAQDQLIFFATPSGVTAKLALPFVEADFPVIDLSGDYRLATPTQYEAWYHKDSAPQWALAKADYGLAEFNDPTTAYIANPGCYATATLLGLAPLVQQNLIDLDTIIVDAKSGATGSGKQASAGTHFVHVNENLQLYKINQHQHIPEIVRTLKKWNSAVTTIQFNTTLLPIDRGILTTIYATPKQSITTQTLLQDYQQTYQDRPFVNVYPNGVPALKDVIGTNNCNIGVTYNEATNKIMIVTVIDNLLKGAAGQAIQNFNKYFDFPETTALPQTTLTF